MPCAHASDQIVPKARQLLQEGKAREAYNMLSEREFERAGDVEFDTLFGVVALDSGHPDRATLAFERTLAVNPALAGARLDLARAYFAMGDMVRAASELDIVAGQNPPDLAKQVIEKYRKAIDEQAKSKRTTVRGYLETFAGYDSNVSSVTSDFTQAVLQSYNLPGFLPTGNSVKRSSPVLGSAGGVELTHVVDERLSLNGGADVRYRGVLNSSSFSSSQIDLRGGLAYKVGQDTYLANLFLQNYWQRTDLPTANRNTAGLSLEWRRALNERSQVRLFGVAVGQRFPDISVNNVNGFSLGTGWICQSDGKYRPVLGVGLTLSQDNALNQLPSGSDVGRRSIGTNLNGRLALTDGLSLFSNASFTYRVDRSAFARSSTQEFGNDRLFDATIGLSWMPARGWTLSPQISYSENRSNVALSEFKRTEASVVVRYDFQ
ncbi:MAG: tetratricopeptide repeat protein [Burkholderiales bacterium]|nr:tetratricopeptide repeat protein [Burkholderiales bacterium]